MKIVVDTSFFFGDYHLIGDLITPPAVIGELRDLRTRGRYEVLLAGGQLQVADPLPAMQKKAREAASRTGDIPVLSETDIDVIALALEHSATIVTDDFAIQNVAHHLQIQVQPIIQRKSGARQWKFRCSGCGRYYAHNGICPVCGSRMKRKLK